MESPPSGDGAAPMGLRAALVLALLVVPVAAGLGLWSTYAARPGDGPQAPAEWPADTFLGLATDRPTLLLFAHPRCPCTRASLENLDRLLTAFERPVRTELLLWTPAGTSDDEAKEFADGSVLRRASAMPGISTRLDPGGLLAAQFGARTSGTALLFGPGGELRYAGGLTFARGHEGDGVATAQLIGAMERAPDATVHTAVFGCSLLEPAELEASAEGNKP